jgi:aldose 1-epimerase
MPIRQLAPFGTTPDGQVVDHYRLEHGPLAMDVLTLGGHIWRFEVPDRWGKAGNVMLNLANVAEICSPKSSYIGGLVGRVAGRIAGARFELDGQTYLLVANDKPNHLHGGTRGYDKRVWTAETRNTPDGPAIELSLVDRDGDDGYPGTVNVTIVYTLLQDGIRIDYAATTDKATPINLTHHAYFNLTGDFENTILEHVLQLDAAHYTPADASLLPTGEILPVKGTAYDFRDPKPIGQDLKSLGNVPLGYDVNFVIDGDARQLRLFGTVEEPVSGRVMRGYTTEPGVQFYSGNFLDGSATGADGTAYPQYAGFCLETQHFPNSINVPQFPSTVLRPGETYHSTTEYRFDLK